MESYDEYVQRKINESVQKKIDNMIHELVKIEFPDVDINRLQEYIEIAIENAIINVYE